MEENNIEEISGNDLPIIDLAMEETTPETKEAEPTNNPNEGMPNPKPDEGGQDAQKEAAIEEFKEKPGIQDPIPKKTDISQESEESQEDIEEEPENASAQPETKNTDTPAGTEASYDAKDIQVLGGLS